MVQTIVSRTIEGIRTNSIRSSMWDIYRRPQDQPSTRPKDTCTTLGGNVPLLLDPSGSTRRPSIQIARAPLAGGCPRYHNDSNTLHQQQQWPADLRLHVPPRYVATCATDHGGGGFAACIRFGGPLSPSQPPPLKLACTASAVSSAAICLRVRGWTVLRHIEPSVRARYNNTLVFLRAWWLLLVAAVSGSVRYKFQN